jgi:hypothetical protein
VSEFAQGPGWWLASDGKWYPPESAPTSTPPTAYPPTAYPPYASPPGSVPSSTPYPASGPGAPVPNGYGYGYGAPAPPRTEPLAIASLVCAIAGTVLAFACGIGVLGTIAAIPLGLVARGRIKTSNGTLTGDGLALAGAIVGGVATAGFVALFFLFVLGNMVASTS